MKRQTKLKLMPDDLFNFLDEVYRAKVVSGLWWNALEDRVREWNKLHSKRMNPAKTIDDFLHRKSQEER